MKNVEFIIGILIFFVSFSAKGAALGQPQRTSMVGYSIGAAHVSVDDPAGNTKQNWALQPITLVYTARFWSKRIRYWSELYYYQTRLDAGLTTIGQDAKRYGMRLSFQKNLPISPKLSVWFGAGADISQAKYSTRYTVDNDGYLIKAYPDREETTFAGLINVVGEWTITRSWAIGAKLEQSIPLNGDIKESLAAVTLLYKY